MDVQCGHPEDEESSAAAGKEYCGTGEAASHVAWHWDVQGGLPLRLGGALVGRQRAAVSGAGKWLRRRREVAERESFGGDRGAG